MRKRIPAGKGIAKAGKKKLSKKIKTAPITPKKTVGKKKETKKTVAAKRTSAGEGKPGVKVKPAKTEAKKSGKTAGKLITKRKAPAKKIAVKKEKTPPAKVKKIAALKKAEKIIKGKKVPPQKKPEKAAAKEKAARPGVVLKAAKGRTSAIGGKKRIRMISKSTSKVKEEPGARISATEKKTQSLRAGRKKLVGISGSAVGAEKEKRESLEGTIRDIEELEGKKRPGREINGSAVSEREASGREGREDLVPENPSTQSMPLPAEYGENGVSLLTVNPSRLFAFWEIRDDTLRIFRGRPKLRLYDVTDADIYSPDASSYIDIEIDNRVGDRYIPVGPGREYVADIGILYSGGIFIGLARSMKVSTPYGLFADEEVVPERPSDTGLRVGY